MPLFRVGRPRRVVMLLIETAGEAVDGQPVDGERLRVAPGEVSELRATEPNPRVSLTSPGLAYWAAHQARTRWPG